MSQKMETILQQGVRSAQASAFYCYVCAGLSAGAAVVAWFILALEALDAGRG